MYQLRVGLLAVCLSLALTAASAGAPVPVGSNFPTGGSPDWWKAVQSDIAAREYNLSWQEKGAIPGLGPCWQAPNRAQNFRVYFTESGPRLMRRDAMTPDWVWGLQLVNVCGVSVQSPKLKAVNNRVEYRRGGLVEWYENSRSGLEQGFTIDRPAPGAGAEISLELAVRGDLKPDMMPDGRTVRFVSLDGVDVMHFGQLKATDADGRVIPGRIEIGNQAGADSIRLVVNANGAKYPITIDPVAVSAAWMAESDQTNAQFGFSVASAGDVNGDGFDDVIIGAPYYDNGQADEGRAYVYLGTGSGLQATAAWITESNQIGAEFGSSVAGAGDVNGDGYDDILVGAPCYDNGQLDEGRAYLYIGSATGPVVSSWTAEPNQASALYGCAVASAGDVNQDGYSDVIVGASRGDDGSQTDEGRAFVYLGSSAGLAATPVWIGESNYTSANFGAAVASAGDVDCDGFGDIVVGAPNYGYPYDGCGQVYVYYGSATGISTRTPALKTGDDYLGYLGCSVAAAGDVNGDGYGDVIAGAYNYSYSSSHAGLVYVYYGDDYGLQLPYGWKMYGTIQNEGMGFSVSSGDLNGDGYGDVIIGSLYGRASVWYGSPTGLPAVADCVFQVGSRFGQSVACAGDVNGDGADDLIGGAPQLSNSQTAEGGAFLFLGTPPSPEKRADWTMEGVQPGAQMGGSVSSAGDVNRDGYDDVIVAARTYDSSVLDVGRVFLYLGGTYGLAITPAWIAQGEAQYDYFGSSIACAGDINKDGYSDVIIGAIGVNNAAGNGKAYVFLGTASGLSSTPAWTAYGEGQYSIMFGGSVASAGDVNHDGYPDIIVSDGNYGAGGTKTGRAYLYMGSASGLATTPAWKITTTEWYAYLGSSVAPAGDVNGDGYGDVLVTASGRDGAFSNSGQCYLYLGSAAGLSTTPAVTIDGGQANASLGNAVSAGDVNGDGFDDVIVGVTGYDNGEDFEGRAYVHFGSATGLSATPAWSAEGNQASAHFGCSIAGADINGDGYSDVIVGASLYDPSVKLTNAGRVFIYLGSSAGVSATAAWTLDGTHDKAEFGRNVASAGDVNADGFGDIVIGAPSLNNAQGRYQEGCAYLFLGSDVDFGSSTWVKFNWQGPERGTLQHPFNTLNEGVAAVNSGGLVNIMAGNTNETRRITRPMRLRAIGGPVRIGVN